jgi:chemotaxis protein MotB
MRRAAAAGRAFGSAAREGGEGGNYFASMTDLMLGLLFIFIIMLMAFALNLREAEQKMASATRDLTEADLARREMLRDVEKVLQGRLPVTVDEENGTLQLGDDVLFPKGSADSYPDALPKLRMLGHALDLVLPCYAVPANPIPATPIPGDDRPLDQCTDKRKGRLEAVYIEGHTDATPIHTARFPSNWDLSAARASETFNRLVDSYPGLGQLRNDRKERLIGVSGYGEYRPVDESGSEEGMKKNRRIELRFIMVSPGSPELHGLIDQIRERRAP